MALLGQIHVDAERNETPIVALESSHLLNIIRLLLIKKPAEYEAYVRGKLMAGYASPDMTQKQARAIGLPRLTEKRIEEIDKEIQSASAKFFEGQLAYAIPYIIVASARSDTYEQLHEITMEATDLGDQTSTKTKKIFWWISKNNIADLN